MSRRIGIQTDYGWPGSKSVYYGHAFWAVALGVFLILSPPTWFGPSWRYFSEHGFPLFPSGGLGLGICCAALGVLQIVAILIGKVRATVVLLYLGGVVQWIAGLLLAAEGLAGHQGLMEAPFMCTIGALKAIQSFKLSRDYRHLRDVV